MGILAKEDTTPRTNEHGTQLAGLTFYHRFKKARSFYGLGCDYHVGGLNEMIPVLPASGQPERPSVGLGFGLGCDKSRRRGPAADRPEKRLRPNLKKGRRGYIKRYINSLCKAICKHPEICIAIESALYRNHPPEHRRADRSGPRFAACTSKNARRLTYKETNTPPASADLHRSGPTRRLTRYRPSPITTAAGAPRPAARQRSGRTRHKAREPENHST